MSKRKHKQSKRDRCAQYLIKCILKENRKHPERCVNFNEMFQVTPSTGTLTSAEINELLEKMFQSGEMEML